MKRGPDAKPRPQEPSYPKSGKHGALRRKRTPFRRSLRPIRVADCLVYGPDGATVIARIVTDPVTGASRREPV